MTFTVFLVDPVDTNADGIPDFPTYPGRAVRQVMSALLAGASAARPHGIRSGVTPGTASTSVAILTSPSLQWSLAPLCGAIDGEVADAAGAYLFSSDLTVTGGIVAADGSHNRVDLLSLQVSDPSEADGSSVPSVIPIYTEGTAASSPSAPSTPARSIAIAQLNVPKAGTGTPTATWVAPYLTAAGGVIPVSGPSDYPANPNRGMTVDDASTGRLMKWNGTIWVPFSETAFCRVSRAAVLPGVNASGSRPAAWDTVYNTGALFTASTSTGPIVATRDADVEWKTSVGFPAGSDAIAVSVEVNGTAFGSGRCTGAMTAHQSWLSTVGDLHLSAGDSVQLVVQDLDNSISTLANLSFSLKRAN